MNAESQPDSWTVAQAKAKLSEVIEKARHQGPQAITRHGKSAVVVVDAALWERTQSGAQRGSFAEFLRGSPLRGSGLDVARVEEEGSSYVVTNEGKAAARIVPAGRNRTVASAARDVLLERLAAQPTVDVGRWSRDEAYEDDQ